MSKPNKPKNTSPADNIYAKVKEIVQAAAPGKKVQSNYTLAGLGVRGDAIRGRINSTIQLTGAQRWQAGEIQDGWTVGYTAEQTRIRKGWQP